MGAGADDTIKHVLAIQKCKGENTKMEKSLTKSLHTNFRHTTRLNKITTANAGIALLFHTGHAWPGVAELWRSLKTI